MNPFIFFTGVTEETEKSEGGSKKDMEGAGFLSSDLSEKMEKLA